MDPPYSGVCEGKDRRYAGALSFDADALVDTLSALNARGISYIVSYDGQTGEKEFGKPLPEHLGLARLRIEAGRSSQATLLGRKADTVESLYLSPALIARTGEIPLPATRNYRYQYPLFADPSIKHIALRAIRRVDVVWAENEVENYERLRTRAEEMGQPVHDYVKAILQAHVAESSEPQSQS